jgi:hypothetical protein
VSSESTLASRLLQQMLGVCRKPKDKSRSTGKLNKEAIGEPMPVTEDTKRELTKRWMELSPQLAPMILASQAKQQQQQQQQRVESPQRRTPDKLLPTPAPEKRSSPTTKTSAAKCPTCSDCSDHSSECSCSETVSTVPRRYVMSKSVKSGGTNRAANMGVMCSY